MKANYWHDRWNKGETGFHENVANPALVSYINELQLKNNARIFLPLCGKTLDIAWLLNQGFKVVGVELSALAIDELFSELNIIPNIIIEGKFTRYCAESLDILVGDIFDLTNDTLGSIDAIYDRAALVALPEDMRERYTAHLINVSNATQQLLVTFDYDQNLIAGPPFSVEAKELQQLYGNTFQLRLLENIQIEGGLKGKVAAFTSTWLLKNLVDK